MSICVTLATGRNWYIYLDQSWNRVFLELEDLYENTEVEIERSCGDDRHATVSVILPEDLVELIKKAL
jgi:hypothetical protein